MNFKTLLLVKRTASDTLQYRWHFEITLRSVSTSIGQFSQKFISIFSPKAILIFSVQFLLFSHVTMNTVIRKRILIRKHRGNLVNIHHKTHLRIIMLTVPKFCRENLDPFMSQVAVYKILFSIIK